MSKLFMLHKTRVAIRFRAKKPSPRTVGRAVYGHVITKFSRMGSLPHFVTHGAPLRALRAGGAPLQTVICKTCLIPK